MFQSRLFTQTVNSFHSTTFKKMKNNTISEFIQMDEQVNELAIQFIVDCLNEYNNGNPIEVVLVRAFYFNALVLSEDGSWQRWDISTIGVDGVVVYEGDMQFSYYDLTPVEVYCIAQYVKEHFIDQISKV